MGLHVPHPADDKDRRVWVLLALPVRLLVLTVLDQELTPLQRALNGDQQLVEVDRLHDEGVRTELQAGDCGLRVGRATDDDGGRVWVLLAHLAEKLDPGYA